MKLLELRADRYRSLCNAQIELGKLNLFIGANAAGKSTILDALRFLNEAVLRRDFKAPMFSRGGMLNLAWKGEAADNIELAVQVEDSGGIFEWIVRLARNGYEFHIQERVREHRGASPPTELLKADAGQGWWWSGEQCKKVPLKQAATSCALAAAAVDASFPAREVAEFIGRWGFFDPNPFLLRRDWTSIDAVGLDHYGRNLGETLHALDDETRQRILEATQAIVGLPQNIEPRQSRDEDRFYFVQTEPGLQYPVHQMGVSSGTLRMLALMTALLTTSEAKLVGIEEPENYVHPTALSAFVNHIQQAREHTQFMITTHSPLVLDALNEPEAVRVVRRDGESGTAIETGNPEGIRRALDESGFGLGEYYETRGFGN